MFCHLRIRFLPLLWYNLWFFLVVYTLLADDVADDEQVGHDCFGYVVGAEVGGGAVCDVGVVVDLV